MGHSTKLLFGEAILLFATCTNVTYTTIMLQPAIHSPAIRKSTYNNQF
ncbi:hypothetical protein GBAR_LOCUS9161 [Geodia barretti]|uniref:Uncharacterized protein n=1 Tax=Geodia barretti TaxID=519541 RepID=A0AA35RQD0_GEOBA|nr:hypothetical protein GBAR_LOCUS9161 [Geodia barretti]